MNTFRIKKGLDLPIPGRPEQRIEEARPVSRVAIVGDDYVEMRPRFVVEEGDRVKKGELLFIDKRMPNVRFTAPAAGVVSAINRGDKRKFQSIVIDVDGDEAVPFMSYRPEEIMDFSGQTVSELLLESGLWTGIRQRPFGKVADPRARPSSIFITAMDTRPLAPDVSVVMQGREKSFSVGSAALAKLAQPGKKCKGKVFVCASPDTELPGIEAENVERVDFSGPHPAGLPGTHIHMLDPVNKVKKVWHVDYQDVIAIGEFLLTGRIPTDRVVSIGGPVAAKPRLIRTTTGACISQLMKDEIVSGAGETRTVSGSALYGRAAEKNGPYDYLGRYHMQITTLSEGRERRLFGWLSAGIRMFSVKRIYVSSLITPQKYRMNTSTNGSHRSMVPIGSYAAVMPLDIVPVYFLRSLQSGDAESAEELGCLELIEEDLSLCTYVSPGKADYGPLLRAMLQEIERDFM